MKPVPGSIAGFPAAKWFIAEIQNLTHLHHVWKSKRSYSHSRLNSVFGPRSRDDLAKAIQRVTAERAKPGPGEALSKCSKDDMFDKRLLEIAWQESPATFIETLLDEGIDLNRVSAKGYTALTECIRWKRFDAAIALRDFGADPNVPHCQPLA